MSYSTVRAGLRISWMRRALLLAVVLLLPASAGRALPALPSESAITAIVLFDRDLSDGQRDKIHRALGGIVLARIEALGIEKVRMPLAATSDYRSVPGVLAVELRSPWKITTRKPNDPLVKLQWSLEKIDAFEAWRLETGKRADVNVAVIDTGVDATHPDLEGRVLQGFDFLDMDDNPADDHGHGTHVAGVIAANADNRTGIAGLSFGAKVIPMKSCHGTGACPVFEVYAGIVDGVRRGADILNLSLGGPGGCSTIDQAVFDWVALQGVVAVAAAGNDGAGENLTSTPANCQGTLGVGATTAKNKRAPFSSYGDWVDIAAPGVQIWSTLPALISINSAHLGYGAWDGTSMATPFVAGAAALVKAKHPGWGPEQITERLIGSARDLGKEGRDDFFGHGLLDVRSALR